MKTKTRPKSFIMIVWYHGDHQEVFFHKCKDMDAAEKHFRKNVLYEGYLDWEPENVTIYEQVEERNIDKLNWGKKQGRRT